MKKILIVINVLTVLFCLSSCSYNKYEKIIVKDYKSNLKEFHNSLKLARSIDLDVIRATEDFDSKNDKNMYSNHGITLEAPYPLIKSDKVVYITASSGIKKIVQDLNYNIWPQTKVVEFVKNDTSLFSYEGILYSQLSRDDIKIFLTEGGEPEIDVVNLYEVDNNWYYYKVKDGR